MLAIDSLDFERARYSGRRVADQPGQVARATQLEFRKGLHSALRACPRGKKCLLGRASYCPGGMTASTVWKLVWALILPASTIMM